jgi:N-acyl homoserine lactone hydrolase
MTMDVKRLYTGCIHGPWGFAPIHGYVVTDSDRGAILVDTGMGGPGDDFAAYPYEIRAIEEALADHGLDVSDITMVITTHLHQDHFGHNTVFRRLPFVLQRAELERGRTVLPHLTEFFDWAGARFELLEGDAEVAPGVRVLSTPGHTAGHQCVAVDTARGVELLLGDAAFTAGIWSAPDAIAADDPKWMNHQFRVGQYDTWRDSLQRLHDVAADRVHLCHDPLIVTRDSTAAEAS